MPLDGLCHAALLAGCINLELVTGWRIMATIASIRHNARESRSSLLFDFRQHGCQRVAIIRIARQCRSCPLAWCNKLGLITIFAGPGRVVQIVAAGNPTIGVSLKGAIVSSVM
jgi:hypothetical protein